MTRYMRYFDYLSLSQLFVRWLMDPKNACNRWNYVEIDEIQGGNLIDPTACGYALCNPRMSVTDGIMTGYMRYWEDISLTQLFVGSIVHPKNACNRWNYDQVYEILQLQLIDPITCGKHIAL